MIAKSNAPRLAVLIDADNVNADHAEAIFKEIASIGEASVRRAFGDWSSPRLKKWKDKESLLGLVADQQSSNTKGKNASDIGLVIAAMDYLHQGIFDAFVLISSDSDFTRLASRIREQGIDVLGIGEMKTPEAFISACSKFIYIENLEPEDEKNVSNAEKSEKNPPTKVVPLVLAAMRAIDPEGEWYSLGPLGQKLTQTNNDFDSRTYGSSKLSDLLRKTGKFDVATRDQGNHLSARVKPQ